MAVVQHPYAGFDVNVGTTGNVIYYCDLAGPPSSGPYDVGDIALCMPVSAGVAPSVVSPLGWRCTTAGSPGTWVALGTPVSKGADVASASSITPTGTTFHVTGTTQVNTIVATGLQSGQSIYIIPDGTFATGTSGNIALASTAVVNKTLIMTWDGTASKFTPSY